MRRCISQRSAAVDMLRNVSASAIVRLQQQHAARVFERDAQCQRDSAGGEHGGASWSGWNVRQDCRYVRYDCGERGQHQRDTDQRGDCGLHHGVMVPW